LPRGQAYARSRAKVERVLSFLESEPFTTREIVGELLGLSAPKAHMFLVGMEGKHLVSGETVDIIGGRKTLWLIGKWRNSVVGDLRYLQHLLDVQLMHARSLNAGYTDWTRPTREASAKEGDVYPDAEVRDPKGLLVAVEVERHHGTTIPIPSSTAF
jgi:hypothetical protein